MANFWDDPTNFLSDLLMSGGEASPLLDATVSAGTLANSLAGSQGQDAYGWGEILDKLAPVEAPVYREPNNYAEQFGLTYDEPGPSMSVPQEPSVFDTLGDYANRLERGAATPLGKLGIGGLGALVSYYGANRQNKLYEKAKADAAAARAAALAQHAAATAPMRFTNQRAALPSWGANQRNAFSGNSLAAMTPRSTNTMYAAEGGPARGQGGLCQACGGGTAHYVEGGTAGQDDKIPAMLSDGEYVLDADFVSGLGDGNNAAGAKKLDKMRQNLRAHKRSAPATKIPPKAKAPEAYLKGAK